MVTEKFRASFRCLPKGQLVPSSFILFLFIFSSEYKNLTSHWHHSMYATRPQPIALQIIHKEHLGSPAIPQIYKYYRMKRKYSTRY